MFADIVISGLKTVNTTLVDSHITFAPGEINKPAPMGSRAMDSEFMRFFGDLRGWAVDPSYFIDRILVTIRPVFGVGFYGCAGEIYFGYGTLCFPFPYITGFQVIPGGPGYSNNAYFVSTYLSQIMENDDYSAGPRWWSISQHFKQAIGVHAFGYRDGGGQVPVNSVSVENDTADLGDWWYYAVQVIIGAGMGPPDKDLPPPPKHEWVPHGYDESYQACDPANAVIIAPGPVASAHCTIANVMCWLRRSPQTREAHDTVYTNDRIILVGNNPIRVYLPPGNNNVINETAEGHVLHDTYQTVGCAVSTDPELRERCSKVEVTVVQAPGNGPITFEVEGTGYNKTQAGADWNDRWGPDAFEANADRIRYWLTVYGQCTIDPR
jgi:hypothetical protein